MPQRGICRCESSGDFNVFYNCFRIRMACINFDNNDSG